MTTTEVTDAGMATMMSNKRGFSGAGVGAGPRGALAALSIQTPTRARGYAAAASSSSPSPASSGGDGVGDGGGGGPTGHAEASSDRVGVGMRGDGTAPRFYKVVDVVRSLRGSARARGSVFARFDKLTKRIGIRSRDVASALL